MVAANGNDLQTIYLLCFYSHAMILNFLNFINTIRINFFITFGNSKVLNSCSYANPMQIQK